MSKSPRHIHAGNIKMRGKKHRLMGCGCCSAFDFRQKNLDKIFRKEISIEVQSVLECQSLGEMSWKGIH